MIDGISPPQKQPRKDKAVKLDTIDSTEEPFRTPEEIAETEEVEVSSDPKEDAKSEKAPEEEKKPAFAPEKSNGGKKGILAKFKDLSKKQKIIIIAAALILLGGTGGGAYALFFNSKDEPQVAKEVKEPEPEPPKEVIYYSPLSGVAVSKEQSEAPVIGVMIENSPDARPQAGLNQAGVVFEAIAEGGITRFLALYQENHPDHIGPIRSVRPYYVDWLQGFDAAIAHVGGSADALAKIKAEGVKDLDQFANSGPYRRVNNRYAPHNMYSSLDGLTDLAKSKGWNSSSFTSFPRKTASPSQATTAKTIDLTISGANYNVHYDYDPASNTYKRVLAGKPHVDERSKEQLSPTVVVAMVVSYSIHSNRVNSVYQTIGSGKTVVFQDGIATEGTWEKASAKAQIIFKDAAGKPIELNAGQTWITAVSIANNIVYKP